MFYIPSSPQIVGLSLTDMFSPGTSPLFPVVGDPPALDRPHLFDDELFELRYSADGCRYYAFPALPYLPKVEPPPTPKVEKSQWEIEESERVEAIFAKYVEAYRKQKEAENAAEAEQKEEEQEEPVRPPQLVVHSNFAGNSNGSSESCHNGAM